MTMKPFRVGLVLISVLIGGLTGAARQQIPADAYAPVSLQPQQAYFGQLPFENVDMLNGNLLLTFTDLTLPGDAGMDLRVVRSYNHQAPAHKWTFGIGGVPVLIEYPDGPIFDPFEYPVLVSANGGSQRTNPVNNGYNATEFIAADFSIYTPATKTLKMANGWVATYEASVEVGGAPGGAMLVQVTDAFGNVITPEWQSGAIRPLRLDAVVQTVSGDTRRVEFGYGTQSVRMPASMTFKSAGLNNADRVWMYEFETLVPGTSNYLLKRVIPPAGGTWTFTNTFGGVSGTDTVAVTTPNGGTVTYSLVDRVLPYFSDVHRFVMTTRVTGGTDIPTGTWTFGFEEATEEDAQREGKGRVTMPDGRVLRFAHEYDVDGATFGRRWNLKSKTLTAGTSTASVTREFVSLPVSQSLGLKVVSKEVIVQDGRSYETSYVYDADDFGDYHRPHQIKASSGRAERITTRTYQHLSSPYVKGLMTSETIAVGNKSTTSSFTYSSSTGFMTSQTVAGSATVFTPSTQGNRASSTDARNKTTNVTYQRGVVKNIDTPEYLIERDVRRDGAITSETRNGEATNFEYDDLGRPTRVAPPTGGGFAATPTVTTYETNSVAVTRGDSSVVTTLDGFGRPILVASAEGVGVSTEYDADGRKVFQSDPSYGSGGGDAFQYDFLGRVTRTTHADNSFSTRTYGDRTVTLADENGNTSVQTWEAYGDPADAVLTNVRDADWQDWVYEYNHLGSLTKVRAPIGPDRDWEYDASNRLEKETHPESGVTEYAYDAVGNVEWKKDARGNEFAYGYDGNNRLTSIDAPGEEHDVAIEYDDADNRTRVTTDNVDLKFGYDPANRLYRREVIINGKSFLTYFKHDGRDNLEEIEYPSGRFVRYEFDDDGRPVVVKGTNTGTSGNVYASGISYHASGVVNDLNFANGQTEEVTEHSDSRRPHHLRSGPLNIWYDYDNVGNVRHVTENDSARSSFNSTFTYDTLDRLESVTGYGAKEFTYDALGNRKTKVSTAGTVTYEYDGAKQRLTSSTYPESKSYTYDNNGNLEAEPGINYDYTPFNMVSRATVVGAPTNYTYDGDGIRVKKSGPEGTRYYVHGGAGQLLAEYEQVGEQVRLVREYVYLGSRLLASIGDMDPTPVMTVTLTSPVADASMPSGQDLTIQATVAQATSTVDRVEFYANGRLLGSDATAPYQWVWPNAPSGNYALLARAVPGTGAAVPSETVSISVFPAAGLAPILDLNGDGHGDVFAYNPATGAWRMGLTQANGTFTDTTHTWSAGWTVVPARFNDDARPDLFLFNTTSGQWYRMVHDGVDGFTAQASGTWWPGWQRFVLDLDADGLSDLFLYDPASGTWFKSLTRYQDFAYFQGAWAPSWEITPMTLNDDGFGDLFLFDRVTGRWFWVLGQAGAGFSYPVTEVWSPSWSLYPADFSGDGLSDLLLYDGATGAYVVAVRHEEGYQYSSGGWSVGWTPYIADLNGTGHDDVFLHDPTTGQWFQMTSVVTFSGVTFTAAGSGGWSLGWTLHPTDFNGDGRTDFLLYHPTSGVWYQARNLTLGDFAYTTGTWPANLTIVGGQTSQSGGQLPEPQPTPTPPLGADLEVFRTEAGPSGPADMPGLKTRPPYVAESPDGASPPFGEYEAPSPPPVDVTLTLDIAGTGSGTVTSSPSGLATCTGAAHTCVGGFETGTVVTLTATAATGHEFTGWGGACQGTDTCTVMMADARYVAAHFRLIPAVGTSFYHLDTLGSVRAVTNAVGDVIRRDDYHAFGEAGTPPMGDPIRFTGKERDAETALDYFGARYYRNLAGRFTTVDPVVDFKQAPENPQRWNRYSYALNDPLKFVDPDGRNPFAIGAAIGAAVFGGWKIVQNVAQGQTWYDGVAVEAGLGLIAGGTLGLGTPTVVGIRGAEIAGGAAVAAASGAQQGGARIGAVIGHFDAGYAKVGRELGAAVFDVPMAVWNRMTPAQQTAANQSFLNGVADRGLTVRIVTNGRPRDFSTLAWEIRYLLDKGYTMNRTGDVLIPPAK